MRHGLRWLRGNVVPGQRRFQVWLGLSAVLGLGLAQLPLFGVLGYELALALSVFVSLAGLDLGAALARRELDRLARAPTLPMLLATAGRSAAATLALVVAPAAIAALSGIWKPTCDWWFGLLALALMPGASALIFGFAGGLLGIAVGAGRVVGNVLPPLCFVALALSGLWRFYSEPPVFSYSPIVGYFPGNLYDENITLGASLCWARLEQVAWLLALAGAVAWLRLRPPPRSQRLGTLAMLVVGAGAVVSLRAHAADHGYRIGAADIQDALAGVIRTEHFVIHYPRGAAFADDMGIIAADHELRYQQVVSLLEVAPHHSITSYYFADRGQKARWMGAHDVEMAKPWRRELYVEHQAFPHRSLRHEIAHIVAGDFGDPLFAVSARRIGPFPLLVNPGLIEGLAVAVDWPGSAALTPHESVRAMELLGLSPDVERVFSLQFLALSSARGYTTAGSFLRFLLDHHGAAALKALYRSGGDFQSAYGQDLAALQARWRAFIATIPLDEETVQMTRERFRGTGVFSRPCPHASAARKARAFALAGGGNTSAAIALMRQVCADDPGEPRFLLDLAALLARGGPLGQGEARELWTRVADDGRWSNSIRGEALLRLADAADPTDPGLKPLLERALALGLDEPQRRQALARRLAIDHRGPAGHALRGYFFGDERDGATWLEVAVLAEPALGLAHYLRGLRQVADAEWAAATTSLARSLELGMPHSVFSRNAARQLTLAAFRAGRGAALEAAISYLQRGSTVDAMVVRDWQQRLARLTFR
jgi:hypothetical protein